MEWVFLIGLLYLGYRSPEAQAAILPMLSNWNKYDERFKFHARQNGFENLGGGVLGWDALKAIALNESDLGRDSRVVNKQWSRDGLSRGLMQLTVPTANDFESVDFNDLDDPETSIRIAAKFFAQNWKRFKPDLEYTIKAYNEGGGGASKDRTAEMQGNPEAFPAAEEYWQRFLRNLETCQNNREA